MEIQLLTFWSPAAEIVQTPRMFLTVTSVTCGGFGLVRLRDKQWQVREPSSDVGARAGKSCVQENQLLSVNSELQDDHLNTVLWLFFFRSSACLSLQRTLALSTREMGLVYWGFFVRNLMLDLRLGATLNCSQL